MVPRASHSSLSLHRTRRFSVIDCTNTTTRETHERETNGRALQSKLPQHIPIIPLDDLLLHDHRQCSMTVQKQLHEALSTQGFCLLTTPKNSRPGRLIDRLRTSLKDVLFPSDEDINAAALQASETIYISERDVPMYRLGYERAEDDIRQIYRVAAGRPDEQPWPTVETRQTWLRALGFLRHVTDTALELLLAQKQQRRDNTSPPTVTDSVPTIRSRPHSGSATWLKDKFAVSETNSLADRPQDFSVLYAMHYFGNSIAGQDGVAVKQHVDPSLLVMEPFLCPDVSGLQVWDRTHQTWLDCDGPTSPLHAFADTNQEVMLLFVGKGLYTHLPELEPTLHRVVASNGPRRTVIYEQKYGEFYS